MKKANIYTGNGYDDFLPRLVSAKKASMLEKNDDGLFVITGPPGSGKSMLAMWIYSLYAANPRAEQFALTPESLARAHDRAVQEYKDGVSDRFVCFDEADVSRRNSLSTWNRDIINLYMTNRVFNILHVWCWPSLHLLDQAFVQERVSGAFVIISKDIDRPRRYLYFSKESLLKMIEKKINLTLFNLEKHASKYALYLGGFRKYEGSLLDAYKTVKVEAASEISAGFSTKYAPTKKDKNRIGVNELADREGYSRDTAVKYSLIALEKGLISSDARSPTGIWQLLDPEHTRIVTELVKTKGKSANGGHITLESEVSDGHSASLSLINRALQKSRLPDKKEEGEVIGS